MPVNKILLLSAVVTTQRDVHSVVPSTIQFHESSTNLLPQYTSRSFLQNHWSIQVGSMSEIVDAVKLAGGTTAAAPPPFRPGNPALCGSRPLLTPYYCRLGDLLCFVFMFAYCTFDLSVYYLFLQFFDTVGWVF